MQNHRSTGALAVVCRLAAALAAALVLPLAAHAAAPAGTLIGNQASATYSDGTQVTRTVTSNTVVTTVQQVASVGYTANGSRTASPGGQVSYPHTITNTGNGTDSYALTSNASGSLAFATLLFYADANGDGLPDNALPIVTTGPLAAGQSFNLVAVGTVPPTAVAGNQNTAVLTATSAFDAVASATVTDTTTVTGQAVIQITQALDVTSGPSPAGPRTITITYTNNGNATATGVTLAETLPAGFTYVANSARWSVTGAGTVLTDANAADPQGGIVYDYNVSGAARVSAVIASVAAGTSGTLTYQVNIAAGLAPGATAATAATVSVAYNDGAVAVPASNGNTVQYTVAQAASVLLAGATVAAAPQGAMVNFADTVTNQGNGTDTFDITVGSSTFPAGTTFLLFQADGLTPLLDTSGGGIPDTGPMAAGAALNVVVKAVLPPGATGGPYTVQLRATSRVDAGQQATATNTLTLITGSTVDLTNDTAVPGATGVGAGPEAGAVLTPAANPGTTTRFALVVSNGSSVTDSFDLAAAPDAAMSGALPAGWRVVFRDASNAVVTSTGPVAAGASRTVYADVSVPPDAVPATTQLYFRALSPATGAGDRLHDALRVNLVRSLVLTPNRVGQAAPGGTVVYAHTLANAGNVTEGDGVASTSVIAAAGTIGGFTTVVHWDRNNDGVLDDGDPVVTSLAALAGGTNGASTAAGLAPGEQATLLVKVTAPAGAVAGMADTATLTVTAAGVQSGVAAPAAVAVTDLTSVVGSPVVLLKAQALDADCDGVADTAYSANPIVSGARPGGCIRYRITATNAGAAAITSLVVNDTTPAQTAYHAAVPAAVTVGSVSAPAGGSAGAVQATVGTLAAGQSAVLTFGVRIAP